MTAPENSAQLAVLGALREPFKPEVIGKLPRVTQKDGSKTRCQECGGYLPPHIHLDYVGHAEVTDRLLSVDPLWQWEPLAYDERGLPMFERDNGNPTRLWIKLTIAGVTRLGVGSVDRAAFDAEKQLIGDAIRNAAMRFGVALELWAKEDLESSLSTPPGINPSTGEIVGGGDAAGPPPSDPPASASRRPPPGRARREKGDPVAGAPSSAGSTKSDQARPDSTTAPPTITPAALDSLRAFAARKGLDDSDLETMAGKDFGSLATLTEPESTALMQQVVKFKQTPGEVGL